MDIINGMKKKYLVDHIEDLKEKIVVDKDIQGLCKQISKILENVDRLVIANEKSKSELLIIRNINNNLQNRTVNLEKQQSPKNAIDQTSIYLFQVNNRNTRTSCEICSKLTIKTPERLSLLLTLNIFYTLF